LPGNEASILPIASGSPDQAWSQYLTAGKASGRVVAEMPLMMVEAEEVSGAGAREVYYIRPVLERVKATDAQVWRVNVNEHGEPVYVPAGHGMDVLVGTPPSARQD
jgi:hypothetical protein